MFHTKSAVEATLLASGCTATDASKAPSAPKSWIWFVDVVGYSAPWMTVTPQTSVRRGRLTVKDTCALRPPHVTVLSSLVVQSGRCVSINKRALMERFVDPGGGAGNSPGSVTEYGESF